MRNSILLAFLLSCLILSGQVGVATLTPQFKGSGGLSLDDQGNLYIGDFGDFLTVGDNDGIPNNIMKLDINLNLSQYATGFLGASGNAFDNNGVLYQSDIGASAIYKIEGGIRTFVTSTGISSPVGIVFDSQNNFFVCNCGNNTIRKVTPQGVSTLFASGNIFLCPNGVTIDEDDNLYVSNFSNGSIIKVTPMGVTSIIASTPGGFTSGPSNGHLDYHKQTRTLYIASHGSNKIFSLSIDNLSNGLITIAGSGERGNSDNENALFATFSRPNGVAVTQTGDSIYINSAIPISNIPNSPLNPQLIRLIKGLNSGSLSVETIISSPSFKIYPNPANKILILESDHELTLKSKLSVKIYDLNGRIIKKIDSIQSLLPNKLKIRIDVSTLSKGTYFYAVYCKNNLLEKGKIAKQ